MSDSIGIKAFENGAQFIAKDGEWVFVDKNGNENNDRSFCDVVLYEWPYPFAVVSTIDYDGAMDHNGDMILPTCYKELCVFREGMMLMLDNTNRFGYLNEFFEVAIPPQYIAAYNFKNGSAFVFDGVKWSLINKKKKV